MGQNLSEGLSDITNAFKGVAGMMQLAELTKSLPGGPYYDQDTANFALQTKKLENESKRVSLDDLFKQAQIQNISSTISTREAGEARRSAPLPERFTEEGGVNPEAIKALPASVQKKLIEAEAMARPPVESQGFKVPFIGSSTPKEEFQKSLMGEKTKVKEKQLFDLFKMGTKTQQGGNAVNPEDTEALQANPYIPLPGETWDEYKLRTGQ